MDAARRLLSDYLPRTRLVAAPSIGHGTPHAVFLKVESELPTGSFKVRGAIYALAVNLRRRAIAEVVASSTGNHGAAVAYAARRLGVRATIFLPRDPNRVKRANIAGLGAAIVEEGKDLTEAFEAATAHAARTGAFFLNDATDPDLPEGPGTIADEILDDLADVDAIYVPVGDTALVRGVAAHAKQRRPSVRIVGVQSEKAPSYVLSWRKGERVTTETADTIADGLATRTPVEENVRAIRNLVDEMRLVSEASLLSAIGRLAIDEHLVAEPAAAASVAAFLNERRDGRPQKIVLLVTGCNVAPDVFRRALCI